MGFGFHLEACGGREFCPAGSFQAVVPKASCSSWASQADVMIDEALVFTDVRDEWECCQVCCRQPQEGPL